MDEWMFERAEQLAQADRDEALRRARAAAGAESHPNFDGKRCVECEDDIPAARIALGKVRCVWCQGRRDRKET